ncbi:MAG: hypothetical protein ACK55I_17690, partial [bacterium]
ACDGGPRPGIDVRWFSASVASSASGRSPGDLIPARQEGGLLPDFTAVSSPVSSPVSSFGRAPAVSRAGSAVVAMPCFHLQSQGGCGAVPN